MLIAIVAVVIAGLAMIVQRADDAPVAMPPDGDTQGPLAPGPVVAPPEPTPAHGTAPIVIAAPAAESDCLKFRVGQRVHTPRPAVEVIADFQWAPATGVCLYIMEDRPFTWWQEHQLSAA